MRRFLCLLFILSISLFFGGESSAEDYNPALDLNSDGVIDYLDIFQAGENWGTNYELENFLELMEGWHSSGMIPTRTITPTPEVISTNTPTPTIGTSGKVLSIPQNVRMEANAGLGGLIMGNIPVHLSEINNLTKAVIQIPVSIISPNQDYTISISDAALTQLTSDFTITIGTTTSFPVELIITIESTIPISQTGGGNIFTLTTYASPTTSEPYPQDVVVPLGFSAGTTQLEGQGGTLLAHTVEEGSLLINPSGSPIPTSTPTQPFGPTSTPTATATQGTEPTNTPTPTSGTEATETPTFVPGSGTLRIKTCSDTAIVDNSIRVFVDILDAQGNIINPGTQGGLAGGVDVTVKVNNSATVSGTHQESTYSLDIGLGVQSHVTDSVAESVEITATADGFNPATPKTVTFTPGGSISGVITGDILGSPQPVFGAQVYALIKGTTEVVQTDSSSFNPQEAGTYILEGLPAGDYDLKFIQPFVSFGGSSGEIDFLPDCTTWAGGTAVTVIAGQDTPDKDVQLVPGSNTGGIQGDITFRGGTFTIDETNTIIFGTPTDTSCKQETYFGVAYVTDTYSIPNLPDGSYTLFGYGLGDNNGNDFQTFNQLDVDVSGGNITIQDVIMDKIWTVTPVSPMGYSRESGTIRFEWTVPNDAPAFTYTILIRNRCGVVLTRSGITANFIDIPVPGKQSKPVSKEDINLGFTKDDVLWWNITGVIGAPGFITQLAELYNFTDIDTYFLIE